MNYYWQPNIDKWIPESANIDNTTSSTISYAYAPNEGEEGKTHVTGIGKITTKEMQNKIVEKISDLLALAKSENLADIDRLYHELINNPNLHTLVKQYRDTTKQAKAKS